MNGSLRFSFSEPRCRDQGRRLRSRCRRQTYLLCLASFVGLTLPALSEEVLRPSEPPTDPLNVPAEPIPSRGGYFGSVDASSALEPPARLRIGDFALQSKAAFATVYDDNIRADDEERDEDIFFSFSPSVRAQSLYARHSLGFGASGTAARALKNVADDFFDWRVGADGRLDLSRQSKIGTAIGYSHDTEDGESVDAEDDQDDLSTHAFNASLSYDHSGDTIGYSLAGSASRLDAEGSDFDDRDRTTLGGRASASYALSDRLSFSAGPSYSYSTYDEEVANDGAGRDAQIVNIRVGGKFKASRTISTSASVGYGYAAFDDANREDDDKVVGNLGLTWNAGAGTILQLRAGQTLGLTVVDDADTRTTTTGSAILTHRLKLGNRSVLSSSLSYRISAFSDLDRTDHDLAAGLAYAYRLTEHVFMNAGYRFSRRASDDNDADFYRNLISLGISFAY